MLSRRPRVLPETLRVALATLGERLRQRRPVEPELARRLLQLHELPPESVVRAEREIQITAWPLHMTPTRPSLAKLFAPRPTDLNQLEDVDGLEYVFLFHRDGHIREAALRKISGALRERAEFILRTRTARSSRGHN
jgi:hypothetical protein